MSPFEIDILLHYYTRTDDHPVLVQNPSIWAETRDFFLRHELLINTLGCNRTYSLGVCGKVYVEALLRLPLPEKRWVMP